MKGQWILGMAIVVSQQLVACSCEEEGKGPPKPTAPISVQIANSLSEDFGVEIYPAEGATNALPVALVLSESPEICALSKRILARSAHLLCSSLPPAELQSKLKKALQFLKKNYPLHLAKPPVLLISDTSRSHSAWRLLLAEPGFFAHAYLEGLKASALTSTTLAALHKGGARTLIVQAENDKRLEFLRNIAKRRQLSLHVLAPGPKARSLAIDLLEQALSHSGGK